MRGGGLDVVAKAGLTTQGQTYALGGRPNVMPVSQTERDSFFNNLSGSCAKKIDDVVVNL